MPDPTYRFWGRTDPRDRPKPPVLAAPTVVTDPDSSTAVLRLYGPIDSWGEFWGTSAQEFQAALDQIPAGTSEIRLHLNSPGGDVYEAYAIANALRRVPAQVTAVVDGLAASAASFLAVTADRLLMAPTSELMIHDAWGVCIGPAADMRDLADRLDRLSDTAAQAYAAKAGGDPAEFRALMLAETWYSAEETVTAGLADAIEGDDEAVPAGDDAAAQARAERFDRSMFRHTGRADAGPPAPPGPDEAAAAARALRLARFDERRAARHRRRAAPQPVPAG